MARRTFIWRAIFVACVLAGFGHEAAAQFPPPMQWAPPNTGSSDMFGPPQWYSPVYGPYIGNPYAFGSTPNLEFGQYTHNSSIYFNVNNNSGSLLNLSRLAFYGNSGNGYQINSGPGISINGVLEQYSGYTQRINANVSSGGSLNFTGSGSGAVEIYGGLNGTGSVAFNLHPLGAVRLKSSGNLSNTATINSGSVVLEHSHALQNATVFNNGGTLSTTQASAVLGGLGGTGGFALGGKTWNIGNNGASTTYSGAMSGSGQLNKIGGGVLTLAGNNTFTGSALVSSGTLNITNHMSVADYTVNGGLLKFDGASAVADVGYGQIRAQGGAVTYSNGARINGGYLRGSGHQVTGGGATFFGTIAQSDASIQQNGSLTATNFDNRGTLVSNATLNWDGGNNSGDLTLNNVANVIAWTNNGVVQVNGTLQNTGTTAIVNGGGGRMYVGSSGVVNAGTMNLNGSLLVNNGTVTGITNVNYGSLAKGSGSFGTVNVFDGGIFSPGNSPGLVTSADATWAGGATYLWEIDDATGSEGGMPGWDFWDINGTLTIAATSLSKFTIDVTSQLLGGTNLSGDAANFNSQLNYDWRIVNASDGIFGFDSSKFFLDTTGFTNQIGGGAFHLYQQGNALFIGFRHLVASEVPAPGSLVGLSGLFAVGTIGMFIRRRRGNSVSRA